MKSSAISNPVPTSILVVISGPSGVGKDAVLSRMKEQGKPFHYTLSVTTRKRRASETDGTDYIFVTTETFQQMIKENRFLEWANVYGNLYGVPKDQISQALKENRDVIVKPDVQGAETIKKLAPDGLFIFLAPPDMKELAFRLRKRMTESDTAFHIRLKTAEREMLKASTFDYVVINHRDRLDDAIKEIQDIISTERNRIPQRIVKL